MSCCGLVAPVVQSRRVSFGEVTVIPIEGRCLSDSPLSNVYAACSFEAEPVESLENASCRDDSEEDAELLRAFYTQVEEVEHRRSARSVTARWGPSRGPSKLLAQPEASTLWQRRAAELLSTRAN
mmetsp:Transcript_61195/g.145718  ORF Transcript_61195/g.145718 Transcript_61195/m.145718 type:complete len:125 (-) Transcript_61195:221-595(-)